MDTNQNMHFKIYLIEVVNVFSIFERIKHFSFQIYYWGHLRFIGAIIQMFYHKA